VDEARSSVPSVDVALTAWDRDRRVSGHLLACAVAYRLFLWMLPLALLVAAVLGFVHGAAPNLAHDLGLGAYVASTVVDAADQASGSRWVLLAIALFALYSASSTGAKTFRAVHGIVWGVMLERPRRSWLAALAFAGCALGIAAMVVATNWVRAHSSVTALWTRIAMIAVFAGVGLLISLALPHRSARWIDLVPGALLIAVGAQILHLFTVLYLAGRLTSSSELYGGLGAAATVLLWLYLIGRLVVAAAVLNATMWERRHAAAGEGE
jgi:uncharacterized BrkB/YihY/UPF0761 family membrane protein